MKMSFACALFPAAAGSKILKMNMKFFHAASWFQHIN